MDIINTNSLKNAFDINLTDKKQYKITVVGVGGAGANMIEHMIFEKEVNSIDLIVVDTDIYTLDRSLASHKMQLGNSTTRSIGSGLGSYRGRQSAIESFEAIKTMLETSDIVFISTGLGGDTGTGAAPIITKAAKEIGALTIAIVTSPFKFEGRKRIKLAQEGLEELKKKSDSIILVPNEKLLSIAEKDIGIKESFRMVDDILVQVVDTISKVILPHGDNNINLTFADVKTIVSHSGLAHMGTGHSTGTHAAQDAVKAAIDSLLLDNILIDDAMGVLVHFNIHPDYPIMEINKVMCILEESANECASIILSTTTYNDMETDEAKATMIATGFES